MSKADRCLSVTWQRQYTTNEWHDFLLCAVLLHVCINAGPSPCPCPCPWSSSPRPCFCPWVSSP